MLDEFCSNTGYNRKYAIRLMNGPEPEKSPPARRPESLLPRKADWPVKRSMGSSGISVVGSAEGGVAVMDAVDTEALLSGRWDRREAFENQPSDHGPASEVKKTGYMYPWRS